MNPKFKENILNNINFFNKSKIINKDHLNSTKKENIKRYINDKFNSKDEISFNEKMNDISINSTNYENNNNLQRMKYDINYNNSNLKNNCIIDISRNNDINKINNQFNENFNNSSENKNIDNKDFKWYTINNFSGNNIKYETTDLDNINNNLLNKKNENFEYKKEIVKDNINNENYENLNIIKLYDNNFKEYNNNIDQSKLVKIIKIQIFFIK